MDLYFLRHAIAVERGTKGYIDDSKRPLTRAGRQKMRQNALGMKALALSFDLILSSPYVRAKQTAEIVTDVFNINSPVITFTKNLIPEASFKTFIAEINAYGPKVESILLVGHEPHLSELISYLLTGKSTALLSLKKGGLCHLRTTNIAKPTTTNLDWLLTPSQLRLK